MTDEVIGAPGRRETTRGPTMCPTLPLHSLTTIVIVMLVPMPTTFVDVRLMPKPAVVKNMQDMSDTYRKTNRSDRRRTGTL